MRCRREASHPLAGIEPPAIQPLASREKDPRVSSVSIALGYKLDDWGSRV
jgi:hypothetical protein